MVPIIFKMYSLIFFGLFFLFMKESRTSHCAIGRGCVADVNRACTGSGFTGITSLRRSAEAFSTHAAPGKQYALQVPLLLMCWKVNSGKREKGKLQAHQTGSHAKAALNKSSESSLVIVPFKSSVSSLYFLHFNKILATSNQTCGLIYALLLLWCLIPIPKCIMK